MQFKSLLIVGLSALLCVPALAADRKSKKKAHPTVQANVNDKSVDGRTFSYALGVIQGKGLKNFLVHQLGVDSAFVDEAVKGMTEKIDEKKAKKLMAYAAGLRVAEMNRKSQPMYNKELTGKEDTTYFDLTHFEAALAQVILDEKTALDVDSAKKIIDKQMAYKKEMFKKDNQEWLAQNKKKEGVITLPSGLQYRVIKAGNGAVAVDTSEVTVHYEGKLLDGRVFDSSYKRGVPANFRPNQVIKGWQEALLLMPEGSTWELYIPAELAYGDQGAGQDIPANATLIFKIEMVKVKPAKK